MLRCEQCQALLLDELYGLLDDADAAAVRSHLEACPACRAARAEAERVRGLLAAAAKAEFPAVEFRPPQPGEVRPAARRPASPARRSAAVPWAVAASVALLVAGLAAPAAWYFNGHYQQSRQVAAAFAEEGRLLKERDGLVEGFKAESERIRADREAAEARMARFTDSLKADLDRAEKAVKDKQLYVVVTGPETLEAGAPNRFQIATRSVRDDAATPATLGVRVLATRPGGEPAEVYKADGIRSRGEAEVTLPPDVKLPAGTELALEVVAAPEGGPRTELLEQVKLGSPSYMAHLATDKPMYQPGEKVRYRSLALDRFNHTPPAEDLLVRFTLTDPKGTAVTLLEGKAMLETVAPDGKKSVVNGPDGKPLRGVASGEYAIPEALPGGEYTLTVSELRNRFPPQQRKFLINRYKPDVLEKVLDFNRKTYGPGDEVVVSAKASAGSTPVARRPVSASWRVDDTEVDLGSVGTTDDQGNVRVAFRLPAKIEKGAASVTLTFDYGGGSEALVKPIPVIVKRLDVEFYAEGGDLVAGVPNRVYFQARTPLGKPAELQATLVDDTGKVVAVAEGTVATLNDDLEPGINQGTGRFTFTPEAGRKYELKIDKPAGTEGKYVLPEPKKDGVVLAVADGVTDENQPLKVTVHSPAGKRSLLVGAYCRGRLLDHKSAAVEPGKPAELTLSPQDGPGGVTRITVFEEVPGPGGRPQARPVAERLVYRRPTRKVELVVAPGRGKDAAYLPGEKASLSLTASDETGKPAAAVVMVGVVNQSVVKMADEKTARSMPTHFLLTSEVRKPEELEYSDVLLGEHPKAATALDLLLGTQGWRRFAEQDPTRFQQKYAADADRVLVLRGQSNEVLANTIIDRQQEIVARAQAEYEANLAVLHAAREAAADKSRFEEFRKRRAETDTALSAAGLAADEARRGLREYESAHEWLRLGVLPVACVLLLGASGVALAVGLIRRAGSAPLYASSAASLVLCVVVVGGLVVTTGPADRVAPKSVALAEAPAEPVAMPVPPDAMWDEKADGEGVPADAPGNAFPKGGFRGGMLPAGEVRGGADKGGAGFPGAPPFPLPAPPGMPRPVAAAPAPPGPGGPGGKPAKPGGLAGPQKDANVLQGKEREAKADGKGKGEARDEFRKQVEAAMKREKEAAAEQDRVNRLEELAGGEVKAGKDALSNRRSQLRYLSRPDLERQQQNGFPGAGGMAPEALGRLRDRVAAEQVLDLPPTVVREYAHVHINTGKDRTDFTETVFWHPAVILSSDGSASVAFDLADSLGRYQVIAAAHTLDGRLGAVVTSLEARKPFSAEPRFPLEVTASDRIDLPVGVHNDTAEPRPVLVRVARHDGLVFEGVPAPGLSPTTELQLELKPGQRVNRLFRFRPSIPEGTATLVVEGQSAPFQDDRVEKTLKVVAEGFPVTKAHSDLLEKVARADLRLPETWVRGTLKAQVSLYPSTLADLQRGLEGLLREPNGCFEQTSTTNYPNLLILDYLKSSEQADPAVSQKARQLLEKGYARLTQYECPDSPKKARQGFEWFGAPDAPHEALTAYGLMQFRDMARVHTVDKALIDRTQAYLLSRLDKKSGHFTRNARALDSFGRAPEAITDVYVLWALTEGSKDDDLGDSLKVHAGKAEKSDDPYYVALVANSLLNRGERTDAEKLLDKLAAAQADDGSLTGKTTSITGSGGRDLQIETTALTVLAWLKANNAPKWTVKDAPADKAIRWIGKQRGGYGGFGSTQATILALKALLAHANDSKKTVEAGSLVVKAGDKTWRKDFPAGAKDAVVIDLAGAEDVLKAGDNEVAVEVTGKTAFPYTLTWAYNTLKPEDNEKCPVRVATKLDKGAAEEGQSVRLTAVVENASDQGQAMTVAVIGLPAGLTLPPDMKQLKELAALRDGGTKPGVISFFELRGTRELVLYWRDLAPKQKVEVNLDLICAVPGEYRGPASRAYLYYNADHKHWADPLKVAIAGKVGE